MFKSNKIFYLVAALILVAAGTFVSAQGANVTNLTPTTDTTWSAGSNNNVSWNHAVGFGTGGSCAWAVALIALRSDGVPATYLNIYGQMTANFHGQYLGQVNSTPPFVTAESGTISLPADALPGRYKVVARCQSVTMGNYEGVSTGIVTVSNPSNRSYYPLILISPTAQLNFTAGVDASGVGIGFRTAEKAGGRLDPNTADMGWVPEETPITVKMIKASDQSTYWERSVNWTRVREGSEEIPYYLSTAAGFNFEDVSSIPAGAYFFRANMQHNSQNYTINSADLIFTAPPQPATLTITSPVANDYWDKDVDQKVKWRDPVGIPAGTRIYAVLLHPDGTQENGPASCRCLGYAAVETGEIAVSTASVLRSIPVGSYYVELRAGDTGAESAVGRSGLFEIGSGPRTNSAITNLATDKTSYAVGDTITITWNTSITDKNDLVLKRYKSDDTFIAQATPNNLLSHTVTVGSTFADNTSYYYTVSHISGTPSAQSNNFSITGGDDNGNGGPPPHRSWAPPLYSPPDCDGSQGFDPGCYPPINVSIEPQTKIGPLTVGSLIVDGGAFIRGVLKLPSLVAASGQFLTTNSTGQVILGSPAGGPGGTPDNYSCPDGQSIGTISNGSVTRCEPDDTGGGGPTDPNVWQKRVSSTCAEGSSIRVIDVNGGVTCEEDTANTSTTGGTVTSVGTGNGLTGGPITTTGTISLRLDCNEGQVLKWVLNVGGQSGNNRWMCRDDATSSVTGGVSKITAGTNIVISPTTGIGEVKISDATYAIPDNSTLTSVYTAIPANPGTGYNTFSIEDGGVTTAKIAADAVTAAKIANSAVGTSQLATDAVTTAKLGLTLTDKSCSTTENSSQQCDAGNFEFCTANSILPVSYINQSGTPNCAVYYGADAVIGGVTKRNWRIKVRGRPDGNLFINTTYECHATCF